MMKKERRVIALPQRPVSTDNGNMKRVAAYCRVSSGSDEQLSSYHAQIRHYEVAIKTDDKYEFAGIYADEGISGTSLKKRNEFKRMMQDCQDGKIDMILTKSVSRFGRNTVDCLNSVRELKTYGVEVHFEKENIYTMRAEGELLLTIMSAVAESESLNMSENIKWGKRRRYEQGKVESISNGKFLGYDTAKDGGLVINNAQAVTVRRVYQLFLDGFGYAQIATLFTNEHVETACNASEWSTSHIYKILTNEKHMGDTRCQKTYVNNHLTHYRVKNRGELPQLYFADTHPGIIDKTTWECVQLEFARQAEFAREHHTGSYHQHSEDLPLCGKIICKACGYTYVLRESSYNKYWRCKRYKAGRYEPVGPSDCQTGVPKEADAPERAFISAWNEMVEHRDRYEPEWEHGMTSVDALTRYRIQQLMQLIEETGTIDAMPYKLMLKVLDHIEVEADGQLSVIFLAGTKLCITQTDITPKKYPRGTHQISTKSWMAQLRMQCGMTQAQLADKVGTIRTYLNLLENGRRIPSKELAVRLGDVLDVPWTRWEEEPIQPKSR